MEPIAALTDRIETLFRHIAETRMAGVPVMHPGLGVAMRGLRRHGAHHVGVLVTPWFMNLIFLPVTEDDTARRVGTKAELALPSGLYEAIWSHEEALGGYWSVSLFSPMGDFADMAGAVATADATLELLFAGAEAPERADFYEAMVAPGAARDAAQRLAEPAPVPPPVAEEAAAEEAHAAPVRLQRRAFLGLGRAGNGAAA